VKLHIDIHPGNGPYLLMVHGFLSSREQFTPNLEALGEVCRPVTLELWGHGRSPVPDDTARFHPEAYIEAFEQIRINLGVETWLLCGQSLGAALTLRYALDHPDRIAAQVFTNSLSAFGDAAWVESVRERASASGDAIRKGGRAAFEDLPFHPKNAKRLRPDIRDALISEIDLVDPEGVARTSEFTVPETPVRDRVHENTVPTLMVCGVWEKRILPLRDFAQENMAHFNVVNIEAGHAVNLEAHDQFDTVVVDFIRQHTGSR